jgi:hypothetical protein
MAASCIATSSGLIRRASHSSPIDSVRRKNAIIVDLSDSTLARQMLVGRISAGIVGRDFVGECISR